ncbi:MAG TPA: SIMPL domain-containing protein [Candidatus Dormibacteraeota bacterium]|nr:SIMPL domain-containing protein [Candidatus Dormibacteraeota bacterium]
MSMQARLLVVCGVLIAVTAASVTALAINTSRPSNTGATPRVLTLAASSTGNTITVIGTGQGSGTPNQADINLAVYATRSTVRDAISEAGNDATHLLTALHSYGMQDKDIQTTSVYVSTQTTCCPQAVVGYNASSQITVTVHSVGAATAVIEVAVDAVGNELQINGINLYVADQSAMLKAARAAAIGDANNKAQDYARLSGHHLGGLIGVSEAISNNAGFGCAGCGPAKGGGGGVPISPGVTSVTVTVAVTYELAS